MLLSWIGMTLTVTGALTLYVAAPHQKLLASPGKASAWAWSGAALSGLGLVALLGWAGPATAIFIWCTLAMLVWSFVPATAAWARQRKDDGR